MLDETFVEEGGRFFSRMAKRNREPVRKRRGAERAIVFSDSTWLTLDEYRRLGKKDLREHHVKPLVRALVRTLKRYKTNFRFFCFDLPKETTNRKVLVKQTDHLFLAVVIEPYGDQYGQKVRITVKVCVENKRLARRLQLLQKMGLDK